jgi:hypothetical protein
MAEGGQTMTKLSKPVRRETATVYRGRPLMAELHGGYIHLREKGRRAGVIVDYRAVFELGWKMLAREKAAAKKARRHA